MCAWCDGGKQLFGYDASLLACAITFGSIFVCETQIWHLIVHKVKIKGRSSVCSVK